MINVTPKENQADCHLIEFPNGQRVLIDIADASDAPGEALKFLTQRGISTIDLIVISHFHLDHYGRLEDLVKSGIKIGRVAINLPADREIADRERPWGCDWEHVMSVLRLLREKNIPYFTPKAGDRLIEQFVKGVPVRLEVVCLYDGVNTPIGSTDVNDTSIMVRLSHGATRALFTGDLNARLGAWLATSDFDFAADLLKVPHHGTESAAPNEFFERVQPKAVLVPSPKTLWFSLRSKRARTYFEEHAVPPFVSGINGHVEVTMTATGFTVRPKHGSVYVCRRKSM